MQLEEMSTYFEVILYLYRYILDSQQYLEALYRINSKNNIVVFLFLITIHLLAELQFRNFLAEKFAIN